MSKKTVELSSKRKVEIREMSIDDVDYCSDQSTPVYKDGEIVSVSGLAKTRTAWLRRGIDGGDFKNFETDRKGYVADSVLKELTEDEKNELVQIVQEHQSLGE